MALQQRKLEAILQKYGGMVTGLSDLAADAPPSALFYLLADKLSYLLTAGPEEAVSPEGVRRRRMIAPVIRTLGRLFLKNPQVFENRNFLRDPSASEVPPDKEIVLPDEPVIWAANHKFKDDTLATVLAVRRSAYILFGSLPQFFNTLDGVTSWLNGVVMANRKVSDSKKASAAKAVRAMGCGADLLLFPEGVWNKSPNALLLDLWPGIYRIACETGAKVVPVVHYLRDNGVSKSEPIHTVVDDPIRLDDLPERAALDYLRDVLATWYYLMLEAYGGSTREEALGGAPTAARAWERQLKARVDTVARYDLEIELCADYRPKWKVRPRQAWQAVADISEITAQNAGHVLYARQLAARCAEEDFQRRF